LKDASHVTALCCHADRGVLSLGFLTGDVSLRSRDTPPMTMWDCRTRGPVLSLFPVKGTDFVFVVYTACVVLVPSQREILPLLSGGEVIVSAARCLSGRGVCVLTTDRRILLLGQSGVIREVPFPDSAMEAYSLSLGSSPTGSRLVLCAFYNPKALANHHNKMRQQKKVHSKLNLVEIYLMGCPSVDVNAQEEASPWLREDMRRAYPSCSELRPPIENIHQLSGETQGTLLCPFCQRKSALSANDPNQYLCAKGHIFYVCCRGGLPVTSAVICETCGRGTASQVRKGFHGSVCYACGTPSL